MKRYIKNASTDPVIVDIEIFAGHPILDNEGEIAASSDDKYYANLPTGPVISKDRNRITQHMIDDFEGFVETIESVCEEKYGLILTYKNVSNDHSHYYNYLAADSKGNIILEFRLRLRISNHPAHRTKEQQANKKEELASEELHRLLSQHDINKLTTYVKVITVNDEKFQTYEAALDDTMEIIDETVKVMKRKAKN